MPGLVPGIHVLRAARRHGRDKPGHDGWCESRN
ncbi:ABC transporter [Bradyrhizobium hipponense]|uniref:ABC transporter n=1 Tax=Bradyrhizobium hipponense TaxID=2605638 RepID=A0A5S4YVR6_9BRAD|nr:ABC transporter [Bradyrhizobium hipponense]